MKDDVKLKQHLSGQTLILSGGVTRKKLKALDEASFDCIVIDGEEEFSLDYLKDFKHKIFKLGANKIAPADISFLSELQSLTLHHAKGSFPHFQCLRQLNLMTSKAWHPSIAQLGSLEFLRVHGWPEKDLTILSRLSKLVKLELVDSRKLENLNGCEYLSSIDYLQLVACSKLADCSQLITAPTLQGLNIESCKVISCLDFLSKLQRLVVLGLDIPRIPSLSILKDMSNLKWLTIGDSLVEDGDIAILRDFPSLKGCALRNKKIYNYKSEQIHQFLNEKWGFTDSYKGSRSGYTIPRFELSP